MNVLKLFLNNAWYKYGEIVNSGKISVCIDYIYDVCNESDIETVSGKTR